MDNELGASTTEGRVHPGRIYLGSRNTLGPSGASTYDTRIVPFVEGRRLAVRPVVTLLPDPEPRATPYTFFSVDDHVIEPAHLFEGRMPAALQELAPRVIELDDGSQLWEYEGKRHPQIGLNAVAGRPPEQWTMEPARFDEMRKGSWDPKERLRDMDIGGIWASLNFPSVIAGFAGTVFAKSKNQELGLACARAWNDWMLNEWCATAPDRFVPMQIPWLSDPAIAAEEVRRNAALGFKAVSFSESPRAAGFPSPASGAWDPFFAACEETDTVVCLHVGSSGWIPMTTDYMPVEMMATLFTASAMVAATEWLWSGVPVRFPNLKIAMSEGGIGWVPMLLDRCEHVMARSGRGANNWKGELSPGETLQRNFWFCTIDDPSIIELRHRIGIDHITLECDYPHSDSTWPDTQQFTQDRYGHLPADELEKITYRNACELFRHPLPVTH